MKNRVYVCHTYYHVYITLLKEFALPKEEHGGATILLSKMSNDFETLKERIERENIVEKVIEYDEKRETFFPELMKYKVDQGSVLKNLRNRIKFTRELGKAEEAYIPIDFKEYKNVYVFCDSDPIGYYLNYKRIKYHAVEDGLNCIVNLDSARYDNRGFFGLKVLMAKLGLIFIQNGYGRYCIDMEVNDKARLPKPMKKHVELPRKKLTERLTKEEKNILVRVFIKNYKLLEKEIEKGNIGTDTVLILTEPLCELDVREELFRDLVGEYGKTASVTIKPHPRDVLEYEPIFPDLPIIDKSIPMEIFNLVDGLKFTKAISVLTEMKAIEFADETVRLGPDFMDKYEAPEIHRQNEQI